MQQQSGNKVEVVVAAIDGENLVLETVPQKNRIHWPLNNIPRPLDVGSTLTLELHQDEPLIFDTSPAAICTEETEKEQQKRQLLERLVN